MAKIENKSLRTTVQFLQDTFKPQNATYLMLECFSESWKNYYCGWMTALWLKRSGFNCWLKTRETETASALKLLLNDVCLHPLSFYFLSQRHRQERKQQPSVLKAASCWMPYYADLSLSILIPPIVASSYIIKILHCWASAESLKTADNL